MNSKNGGNDRFSDFYFLIRSFESRITNKNKNVSFTFTLEIPHEGLMEGSAGESAEGIVAQVGHFDSPNNFDFHSVLWPEMDADNWAIDSTFGNNNQAQVTVKLTLGESVSGAEENSIEYELSGAGSIQTRDWSSHQRAQAEENSKDVWDMFRNSPDGIGRIQEADNPQAINFHFAQFITKFPEAEFTFDDRVFPHTSVEGTEAEFEVQIIPQSFFSNTEHFNESYNWSIAHPTGSVGHKPIKNDDLNNRNQRIMTIPKARWFAEPDEKWYKESDNFCEYRINIEVGPVRFENLPWTVGVEFTGHIDPREMLSGEPKTEEINGSWKILGKGTHERDPSQITPVVNAPSGSDFYDKILSHENHHIKQYKEIEPFSNIYSSFKTRTKGGPRLTLWEFYQIINDSNHSNEDLFRSSINNSYDRWKDGYGEMRKNTRCELEWQAYKHMEEEGPFYLHLKEKSEVAERYKCEF